LAQAFWIKLYYSLTLTAWNCLWAMSTSASSRVVVMFNPGSDGHLNPMLGLADALIQCGWQVHLYTRQSAKLDVEGVGCHWESMGDDTKDIYQHARDVITNQLGLVPTLEVNALPFTVVPATLSFLPHILKSAAELKPRFIVYDACAPWGSIAADILQVPGVSLMTALPSDLSVREQRSSMYGEEGQAILDAAVCLIEQKYGVAFNHNHAYEVYAPYTLITSSRAWHSNHAEFSDSLFHYWGPLVSERRSSRSQQGHDAVERLLDDVSLGQIGKPLFFCSLGTVTTGESFALFGEAAADYYVKLCKAAAMLPHVTFIFAVGKGADVVESVDVAGLARITKLFGEKVPDNVVVARSVDQPAVLRRANGFLTHCGQNSCSEAVLAAVPVITAPFFGDQISNAIRFEELGCGFSQSYHADLKSISTLNRSWAPDLSLVQPHELAQSFECLLRESRFKDAIAALRDAQNAEIGIPVQSKVESLINYASKSAEKMTPSFAVWACGDESRLGGA